jgi:hypothetical protein
MPYATFSIGKWSVYRGENETLPLLERKKLTKAVLVINGIKNFSYETIKIRGVEACIGDVKQIIKHGQFGKIYRELFVDIDDQYFTDNDYDLLASYFDQFMKEVDEGLNPKPKQKTAIYGASVVREKKEQLVQKKVDLTKSIADMKEELKRTEEEASTLDLEAITSEIDNGESYVKAPEVPL